MIIPICFFLSCETFSLLWHRLYRYASSILNHMIDPSKLLLRSDILFQVTLTFRHFSHDLAGSNTSVKHLSRYLQEKCIVFQCQILQKMYRSAIGGSTLKMVLTKLQSTAILRLTWIKLDVKCSHTPSALNAGAKRSGATCHMAMPQCCYLAKGAKRPSHTTNTIKFDLIPFDLYNSIKRFDLCPFDQNNSTYLQPPSKT